MELLILMLFLFFIQWAPIEGHSWIADPISEDGFVEVPKILLIWCPSFFGTASIDFQFGLESILLPNRSIECREGLAKLIRVIEILIVAVLKVKAALLDASDLNFLPEDAVF